MNYRGVQLCESGTLEYTLKKHLCDTIALLFSDSLDFGVKTGIDLPNESAASDG